MWPADRYPASQATAGADIRHDVVHNGKKCGTIVYDSKNRNAWRDEYATKLRVDQIAAKAEHAWHEVEATLAAAIRSSGGGQMTRRGVFLAGVCAQHLVDKLVLAGFLVMRRRECPAEACGKQRAPSC